MHTGSQNAQQTSAALLIALSATAGLGVTTILTLLVDSAKEQSDTSFYLTQASGFFAGGIVAAVYSYGKPCLNAVRNMYNNSGNQNNVNNDEQQKLINSGIPKPYSTV